MTEGARCEDDWGGVSDDGAGSVFCGTFCVGRFALVGVLPAFERAESGLFS